MTIITEDRINNFIRERKVLNANTRDPPILKKKQSDLRAYIELTGDSGQKYLIIIRKAVHYDFIFSVSLFLIISKDDLITLVRYNCGWHPHTNHLENQQINGFHIHRLTERYQNSKYSPNGYAEPTNSYNNWETAYRRLLRNLNIVPQDARLYRPL